MTKQTTNTLLIIGGVVVVYYLYTRASRPKAGGVATPNSTAGVGTPQNNSGGTFGTLGGLVGNAGTLYNDITNSGLYKGIFGGTSAPSPVTNSPSQSGASNNASGSLSDLIDNLNNYNQSTGGSDYIAPADSSGNGSGLA